MRGSIPTVMVIYGTRPEAIKVAPVIRAIQQRDDMNCMVVTTGQHREMLEQTHRIFGIVPDIDMGLMRHGQALNILAARILEETDHVLATHRPDAVLVQGDTTTVMAAGIAAFNRSIPVIHLEAGLRSHDLLSPFPEEANRKVMSQIASLHLAPTEQSRLNLQHDGVPADRITVTGNTVTDALQWASRMTPRFRDKRLQDAIAGAGPMVLLTTHRRENLGANMQSIGAAVARLALESPELTVVWPAHKNPAVREVLTPLIGNLPNVLAIEPLDYVSLAHVLKRADLALTDSGGIQEEAPSLGTRVLVLRDNTERPEGLTSGAVSLIGTETERIVSEVRRVLIRRLTSAGAEEAIESPYGDGHCAPRCVDAIASLLPVPVTR